MPTKKTVLIITGLILIIVFFLARSIVMPFLLAAIFAYIFNPVIKLLVRKTNLSRFWAVIVLFVVLVGLLVFLSSWIIGQIIHESRQISREFNNLASFGADNIKNLPSWSIFGQTFSLQTLIVSSINSITLTISRIQGSLLPVFTGALGYIIKLLLFIVAFFYLLKDGSLIIERILSKFPKNYETEMREIVRKINVVVGGYLRGQVLLIVIMGTATSVALTLLGVKYAIVLGLVSGFLELIPFVGPVVAGGIAATVAFITEGNNFSLDPTTLAFLVVIIYFVLRQLEDYFINPWVLGRLTQLHPLLVIFSTLAGGAIAGPIGFVLGVPVAACGRVLLEWAWEKAK